MACLVLPRVLVLAEQLAGQVFFAWRGTIAPPAEIALVSLNQQAAEALGQPRRYFSRILHAQLINQLTEAGARLIVFDVAFKDARTEEEDASLEAAIKASNRVVLFDYLKRYQLDAGVQGRADVEEIIPPLQRFKSASRGSGHFVLPKSAGLVDHFYPVMELQGEPKLSQPLTAFSLADPVGWQAFLQRLNSAAPEFNGGNTIWQHIKHFSSQQQRAFLHTCSDALCLSLWHSFTHTQGVFINLYGPPGHLPQWQIDDVLAMALDKRQEIFREKIVYVGLVENQQTEQLDAYRTVYSKDDGLDLSGVEISASALGNLLHRQMLTHVNYSYQSVLLGLWLFALWLISQKLSPRIAWMFGAAWHLGYFTAAYWMFAQHYYRLPLACPLVLSLMFYSFDVGLRLRANKLRYQNLIADLTNYMPAQAAKALTDEITHFAQHNQVVSGVCLLTDIQGYTRLAEELPPAELHELMNLYYTELIDEVKANGGIVANIVGDALLALWLDTHISVDACLRASRTACAIQKRLQVQPDLHRLPTSCAMHGGEFSLGHLGARGHFEYSPVGDMVNTVSRMEPFNRSLGTRIICSDVVAAVLIEIPCEFAVRDLGAFNLRNKLHEVHFYQLYEPGINPAQNQLEFQFKQALAAYKRAPEEALTLLQALTEQFPQDGPSRYYLQQCKRALEPNAN
ncbi:MAG TPA: adenylate/guanylate cyclase domain-containing protein [Cellvibrionaceae bacterium]